MHSVVSRIPKPILLLALGAMLFPVISGCARKSVTTPAKSSTASTAPAPTPGDTAKKLAAAADKASKADKEKSDNNAALPDNKTPDIPPMNVNVKKPAFSWMEKNQQRMTASAEEALFDATKQNGILTNFSASLYENGKLSTSISAPKAVADMNKRTVVASGGVVVKSLTRDTIVHANWIKWYSREQKVIGNGGVTMITTMNGGKLKTTGAAFVSDTALKTIRIKSSSEGLK